MLKKGRTVYFVILAAPRTGSNMLSSLLHSHPDILCHHELYNPKGMFYALDLRYTDFSFKGMDILTRDKRPLDFLNHIWQHPMGHSHVGFKMTHYQNPIVFNALLEETNILKIVLHRKNRIATHVSKLIAEQRGIWEDYGNQLKKDAVTKVYVDHERLQQDIDFNNEFYDKIKNRLAFTNQSAFHINYESLTSPEALQQLLYYLGCKQEQLQTTSRKQNPEQLSDLISNYNELAKLLNGTVLMNDLVGDKTHSNLW